ncbi:hypothetical protein J6590_022607 [Homalodisca vitripennis]|nr:hypothetical protein J6590_022607 [Homalodisca vitripennis]
MAARTRCEAVIRRDAMKIARQNAPGSPATPVHALIILSDANKKRYPDRKTPSLSLAHIAIAIVKKPVTVCAVKKQTLPFLFFTGDTRTLKYSSQGPVGRVGRKKRPLKGEPWGQASVISGNLWREDISTLYDATYTDQAENRSFILLFTNLVQKDALGLRLKTVEPVQEHGLIMESQHRWLSLIEEQNKNTLGKKWANFEIMADRKTALEFRVCRKAL